LIEDLTHWQYLYAAGRLHKPVYEVTAESNSKEVIEIKEAMQRNFTFAAVVSFLLLPEKFSKIELYKTISRLSYIGDIRLKVAESPNKINNIVEGDPNTLAEFEKIYGRSLAMLEGKNVFAYENGQSTIVKLRRFSYLELQALLPPLLFSKLQIDEKEDKGNPTDDLMKQRIAEIISGLNKKYSLRQTTKGIITAGITKSVHYGIHKLKKKYLS
jgi:translocator assembly and maintenance protein 41